MCRWRGLLLAACGLLIASPAAQGTIAFRTASEIRVGAGPLSIAYANLEGPRLIVGRDGGLALVGPLDSDFPTTARIGSIQFAKSVVVGAFTGHGSLDIACIAGTDPVISILKGTGQKGTGQKDTGQKDTGQRDTGQRDTGNDDFGRPANVEIPGRPRRLRPGGTGVEGTTGIFVAHDAGVSWLAPLGGGRFVTYTVSAQPFPTEFDVGDVNGDGAPDVVIVDGGENRLHILTGHNNGTFDAATYVPTLRKPTHVIVADGNADGRADLFVIGQPGLAVHWTNADGTYKGAEKLWTDSQLDDATAADADGDGTLDVVVTNSGRGIVGLLLGAGDGTFELRRSYVVGAGPSAVIVADVTRDNRPDILVLNELGDSVTLLRGLGGGHFDGAPTVIGTAVEFSAMTIADLDEDGHLDIAVTSEQAGRLSLFLGNGRGDFAALPALPVGRQLRGIVAGELDGNEFVDLAISDFGADRVAILAGNGRGSFEPPRYVNVGLGPGAIVTGNFQGLGNVDLAVANSLADSVTLLYNDGKGGFANAVSFPVVPHPSFLLVGDINSDRRPDLLVGNDYSDSVTILNGDGHTLDDPHTDKLKSNARTALAEDFDHDGYVDLAVPNEVGKAIDILPGVRGGGFGERMTVPVGHQPRSIATGDLNGDGRTDLVVLHRDPPAVTILLNETARPHDAVRQARLTGDEHSH